MNKLSRFITAITETKSDIDRYFLRNLPGQDMAAIMDDPYTNVSLVYTCISTTARAIAQVPLMVVKYDARENPIPVATSHPWQKLLNKPNYMMSRGFFLETLISFWMLDGNVCIIPFPPNSAAGGVPQSLWPVRWKYMTPEKDGNGHLSRWLYKPNQGTSIPLEPSEVLHLKFFNPNDNVEGLAPHQAGKLPIQTLHKAANYNSQFFENGAVPGGVMHTDKQLSKTTFDRTKAQVNQEYGVKSGQAHKIMVLEQGLKWAGTGLSQRDMEFINLHRLNAEEILQIYGMKKSIISITGDLNFATATAERKEWWHGTCLPLMRLLVDTFSFGLFEQKNLNFDLLFDISSIEALHEAFAEKSKTAEILLRLGFTRNEVNSRLELGFPNVKWGDTAYMPVNMMPVNLEGFDPFAGGPGGVGGDNPNPNNPQDNPDADPTPPETPPQGDDEPKSAQLAHLTRSFEGQMVGKLKRVLFDMRKNTLEISTRLTDDFTPSMVNFDSNKVMLTRFVTPILAGTVEAGYQIAVTEKDSLLPEDIQVRPDIVSNYLVNLPKSKLLGLIEQVKLDLEKGLLVAKKDGTDIGRIIRDVFNQSMSKAKNTAHTEVLKALNFGIEAGSKLMEVN